MDKGATLLYPEMTKVKAFHSRTFGGPLICEGHRNVSPPKFTTFGTLGKPSTFGDIGTSKRARKVPLGHRPDSPESCISTRAALVGLHVGQLKMDMPPIFTTSEQQNVRGWLMKMERYFKLMRYPFAT